MTPDQMSRLVENVKRDGFLSQLPFGVKIEEKFKVISGNHRVTAAIKAKLEAILILYIEDIDTERELAIQLSHNSIAGQDDLGILKNLYLQIKELDWKAYSGIDEQSLLNYQIPELVPISESDIKLNEVRLFYGDLDLKQIDQTLELLEKKLIDEKRDRVVLGEFERFVEVMTEIKRRLNVKNHSVAFLKMIEICEEWIETNENDLCA
ncbi:ParB N-terminal domain-containing protein [Leptospira santarosai]|uniref:ParB N-terminal domain-containing protein n=1 Tax=Leptospira santarosai TaxID=28183 RepID=UPI00062D64E6|nr:ParB N-terminal domain-containing protein [Leptospira santarosai]OLY59608.1 chromosome partitioning protein ParB [Leptospira santarosai serovar Guaricura]OLY65302.1 chromosome partitioning protein ParB [Leptospira santarosai serovar Grippotyphosa]ONF77711.1 chromosome partitioning protein ParB [Leptospira santarosai serovar Bananal]ONF87173.1 chromosome partitioning protein ParB [Leptospira santarosai serovar Grippotyphosa]